MAADKKERPGLRVAVTGATGDLGRLLLPRLLADPGVRQVVAIDLAKPPDDPKIDFHRIDLTRHEADRELFDALGDEPVDALFHLAFMWGPRRGGHLAHELEVMGSMRVLEVAERGLARRLIFPSLTAVYGPSPEHPAMIREDAPLAAAHSRFVSDKVEMEALVQKFSQRHPHIPALVLRLAPLLGEGVDNPATRFLTRGWVPTLLGFDPLWQALHPQDAAAALHLGLRAQAQGIFNIVSEGVLPLSAMVRLAGGRSIPLPGPLARGTLRAMDAYGGIGVPESLLDFIHYPWVADGSRAKEALGFVPRHHARDAVAALRRS